jgi:FAD/FMN-containing dehydrogenase
VTPEGYIDAHARRSWGRIVRGPQSVATPYFEDDATRLVANASAAAVSVLGVGLGRSYGDSGLNIGAAVVDMTKLDRLLAFDPDTGVLCAEAGMSLSDVIKFIVPRGWFLPTTPGTRFVTLAGAVANDVHGKNHHRAGTFGTSILRIGLLRSDRGSFVLSQETEPELFQATIGGLGLTGLILWVEFKLVPIPGAYITSETIAFADLEGFFSLARESVESFEHTVAWVDCTRNGASLGRGLFNRGNWCKGEFAAHTDQRRLNLPFEFPSYTLNSATLRLFTALYFNVNRARGGIRTQHYAPFLYPLDAIAHWNRIYGSNGFYQYQCVVPPAASHSAVRELLSTIAESAQGSLLVVVKTFGARESPGLLSFPFEGTTVALDFPNRGQRTLQLMDRLDAIVSAANGRLYPAKDGRLPAKLFRQGYPNLERFTPCVDPAFSSSFWRRMRDD